MFNYYSHYVLLKVKQGFRYSFQKYDVYESRDGRDDPSSTTHLCIPTKTIESMSTLMRYKFDNEISCKSHRCKTANYCENDRKRINGESFSEKSNTRNDRTNER